MRRRSARPEDLIQKAVFQHIDLRGTPGAVFWHVPNQGRIGGRRGAIQGAILKSMGLRKGWPDVNALHLSHFYAIELKAEGGRASTEQLERVEQIRTAGGFAVVCVGLDRALACLETWGLLRGVAA